MQVILLESIGNVGTLGDLVEVRPGFARNFLLPSGKARMATKENIEDFEQRRAEYEAQQELTNKIQSIVANTIRPWFITFFGLLIGFFLWKRKRMRNDE